MRSHTVIAKPIFEVRASVLRAASSVLLFVGLAAIGYAAYALAYAYAFQEMSNRNFEAAPARMAPRVPEPPPVGSLIGRLEISRLGLRVIVLQGDSAQVLRRAVGHLPDTNLPGEAGNVALAGHRDTFFRPLRGVRPGDVITLETPSTAFQYQVVWTRTVPPTDVQVLRSTEARELTLVTCFPFDYVGSAPNRFVVRAREIGEASR